MAPSAQTSLRSGALVVLFLVAHACACATQSRANEISQSDLWTRVETLFPPRDQDDSLVAATSGGEDVEEFQEELALPSGLRGQMEDSLRELRDKEAPEGMYRLSLSDVEIATALSFKHLVSPSTFEAGKEARDALMRWQAWIAKSHPSSRCREGAWGVLSFVDEVWPEALEDSDLKPSFYLKLAKNLTKLKQCGDEVKVKKGSFSFEFCKEYTCGLWETFHAMSVSASADMPGSSMMAALRGFIDKFFSCSVCRSHFLEVLADERTRAVRSTKDFALWLWEAHNVVNMRLGEEEEERGTGVPGRPKHAFPHPKKCDRCYLSEDPLKVSKGGVHSFLKSRYGLGGAESTAGGVTKSEL